METVKLIGVLIGGKKGSAMPFGGFIWTIQESFQEADQRGSKSLVKKTDKDPKFDEKKVDVWKEEDDIVLNLRTFRSLKKFKWLTVFR